MRGYADALASGTDEKMAGSDFNTSPITAEAGKRSRINETLTQLPSPDN